MIAAARLPSGFVLQACDRLDSTNDEVRRQAEAGAPSGLVVCATEQTRGRGRYGRAWASPPGNLYASVLLRPACPVALTAQLSLVAGLALAEALVRLGPRGVDLKLKWPNDVLIGGAKVAGVLLEGAGRANGRAAWVVVGTGVNLLSCPQQLPYPASHLAREGFRQLAPRTILEAYLADLDAWLGRWRSEGFAALRAAWLARGYGVGGDVRLRLEGRELRGRFLDLSESGALLLEEQGGGRREIAAGEVFGLGA